MKIALVGLSLLALVLPAGATEKGTVHLCGGARPVCLDIDTGDVYGLPTCGDYELNQSLIDALDDDPSAAPLLRRRLESSTNFSEKLKIARGLIEAKADTDGRAAKYIQERIAALVDRLDLPADTVEKEKAPFEAWCVREGLDAERDFYESIAAMLEASRLEKKEATRLCRKAALSNDEVLAEASMSCLAELHDRAALEVVRRFLQRPDSEPHAASLEVVLAFYDDSTAELARQLNDGVDPTPEEIEEAKETFNVSSER